MKDVCAWDTETTGLILHHDAAIDKQPRIVEIALTRLSRQNGKVIAKHSWLVNPLCSIPKDATAIHGISDDDVRGKPTFAELWPDVADEFSKCDIAFAHNSPFDDAVLRHELRRNNLVPRSEGCRSVCTIGLYRDEFGYDPKLVDLYKHITGKEFEQVHRGASDVDALVAIIQAAKLWRLK